MKPSESASRAVGSLYFRRFVPRLLCGLAFWVCVFHLASLPGQLAVSVLNPANREIITGSLTYAIEVKNLSETSARNVIVTDALPTTVQFVVASNYYSVQPEISGGNVSVVFSFPEIKGTDTARMTVTILPMAVGTITNTVSAIAEGMSVPVTAQSQFEVRSVQVSIHDPALIKEGDTYYLFSSGPGITFYCSKDMKSWRLGGRVFPGDPAWARSVAPLFNGHVWAPDIIRHGGKFYLFYAVSSHGQNSSAIGVTVNRTLDPDSPDYHWDDRGIVLRSVPNRDLWNAIDPNVVFDEAGTPWLCFGSFWAGIKLVRLDLSLTKVAEPQEWYSIAKRERSVLVDDRRPGPAEIEGPFIFKKGDYYYLFVSWGLCCRGKDSTYRIMVGRSKNIRGPYLDREGKSMAEGGGTLVLAGNADWAGPGHNSAYTIDGKDYIVFHAYEVADGGLQKLKIAEINWDDQGWPVVDENALYAYQSVVIK